LEYQENIPVQNQTYPEVSQTKASAVIQVISKTRLKPMQFLNFFGSLATADVHCDTAIREQWARCCRSPRDAPMSA